MKKIIVKFLFAENGLTISENNNMEFLIAGNDKIFKKAQILIKGNELILWNSDIKKPAAVRYAWSNTSIAVLFNKEGLPASSFRTDDWD